MTIGGALSELQNLMDGNILPDYYKPVIKKVIETIQMEFEEMESKQTFEGMTNGEVIQAIFPVKIIKENGCIGIERNDGYCTIWFDEEWWNAPYGGDAE